MPDSTASIRGVRFSVPAPDSVLRALESLCAAGDVGGYVPVLLSRHQSHEYKGDLPWTFPLEAELKIHALRLDTKKGRIRFAGQLRFRGEYYPAAGLWVMFHSALTVLVDPDRAEEWMRDEYRLDPKPASR